ncbi:MULTISPECIES: ATP-binding protein [unclassified Frankia]|uniref:ATP-binding protein n=1 Tax=unclassified Frankia TaxID=2632575 RepID=UPI002AD41A63|nr:MULTISPECIES: ATP-binding protein [unclassified Frankia]
MVVSRVVYQGQPVVQIDVSASRTPPVRFDNVVWVRPGSSTRRATRDDERVLSQRRRSFETPFDVRPVAGSTTDDLDLDLFRSDYLRSAVDLSVLDENGRPTEQHLASLRLADIGLPDRGAPSDNFDRVNDYRNPSLAAAMKSLGYVNQFGRGIGRVRASLSRNGNPEAGFIVDDASWTVTLKSTT